MSVGDEVQEVSIRLSFVVSWKKGWDEEGKNNYCCTDQERHNTFCSIHHLLTRSDVRGPSFQSYFLFICTNKPLKKCKCLICWNFIQSVKCQCQCISETWGVTEPLQWGPRHPRPSTLCISELVSQLHQTSCLHWQQGLSVVLCESK